jgi:membrane protein implicated in regulation of membrane protease activity
MTHLPWRRRVRRADLDAALDAHYRHAVHACQPATSEQIGRELSVLEALTMHPKPAVRKFGDRLLDLWYLLLDSLLGSLDDAVYWLLKISARLVIPVVTGAATALITGLATWAAGESLATILISAAIALVAVAGVTAAVRAYARSARAARDQVKEEQEIAESVRMRMQQRRPGEDQVFQVGSHLIVKVDQVVNVFHLTAAEQAKLDQQFQLNRSPHEIITALNLTIVSQDESLQNRQ